MSTTLSAVKVCPHCGSDRVDWSRSRGRERLVRFLGIGYFRCMRCKSRFQAFRAWSKKQWRVLFMVGGFLAFVFVLWQAMRFMGSGGAPPP
jgi:hypothetical protein